MQYTTFHRSHWLLMSMLVAGLTACTMTNATDGDITPSDSTENVGVNPSFFLTESLAMPITEEACTLSGGTETTCYRIVTSAKTTGHSAGPWCPPNINSSAEEGGIWLANNTVNDVSGEFIENLPEFYNDPDFVLYDENGDIRITDTQEAFEAAARPDVAEEYNNYCVEGQLSYIENDSVNTYIIPKTPVVAKEEGLFNAEAVGVAFNGVRFDPPAPTEAILAAHTLAPFDDCGGHVNPHTGYHYHAHMGCSASVEQSDGHAALIGYAMDGYGLYARTNTDGSVPSDLDANGGHSDSVRGYHYHIADAGSNSFINGFHGETGCAVNGDTTGTACDATASTRPPRGERPEGGPPSGTSPAAETEHSHENGGATHTHE